MQIIDKFPPDFECEPFYDLVEKWFAVGAPDKLPGKADFQQEKMCFRGYEMTVEMDRVSGRFQYTSVSPQLEKLYGKKMAGNFLDRLYNPFFRKVALQNYQTAFDQRLPLHDRRTVSTIIKKIGYQKIILPVGEGDQVSECLAILLPTDREIKSKEDWESLVRETPWL